jgi:hypothetical protein
MLSHGGEFGSSWLRRYSLAIMIGFAGVWCRSANALAQDAHPTELVITAHLTARAPEWPGFEKAPYLVVGMVDRSSGQYGSFATDGDKRTSSSEDVAITRPLAPSANPVDNDNIDARRLVLASLSNPWVETAGTTPTIRTSHDRADSELHSLLDSRSVESFLYGQTANEVSAQEWLADDESSAQVIEQTPEPLWQLRMGSWILPVRLFGSAISTSQ